MEKPRFYVAGTGLLQSDRYLFTVDAQLAATKRICGGCNHNETCFPGAYKRNDQRVQVEGELAGSVWCALVNPPPWQKTGDEAK